MLELVLLGGLVRALKDRVDHQANEQDEKDADCHAARFVSVALLLLNGEGGKG